MFLLESSYYRLSRLPRIEGSLCIRDDNVGLMKRLRSVCSVENAPSFFFFLFALSSVWTDIKQKLTEMVFCGKKNDLI